MRRTDMYPLRSYVCTHPDWRELRRIEHRRYAYVPKPKPSPMAVQAVGAGATCPVCGLEKRW